MHSIEPVCLDFRQKEEIFRKLGALNARLDKYKARDKLKSRLHAVLRSKTKKSI